MSVGLRLILLVLAVAVVAPGCRLFSAAPAPLADPLDVSVLNALRERLQRPLWRRRNVSLIRRTETVWDLRLPLPSYQWEPADPLLRTLLRKLDEESSSRPYLVRLAAEEGRVGRNAVVLLARRHPAAAVPFASRLRDMVAGNAQGKDRPQKSSRSNSRSPEKTPTPPSIPADGSSASAGSPASRWERLSLRELVRRMMSGEEEGRSATGTSQTAGSLNGTTSSAGKGGKRAGGEALSPTLRGAAAEAWCRLLLQAHSDPIEALAPAGRLLLRADLSEEVRITLWWSVAPHVPPGAIPHLNDVFHRGTIAAGKSDSETPLSPAPRLRRAAMEVCVIRAWHQWKERLRSPSSRSRETGSSRNRETGGENVSAGTLWPTAIRNAAHDADATVRILFGRWAALTRIPDALDILRDQRRDMDETVQRAALASLAVLGTPPAREQLRQAGGAKSAGVRAGAVRALARWGPAELVRFLSDPSPAVRQAVAESAGRRAEAPSAAILRHLLRDSHLHVQQACVQAVADWPDELAIPLLLEAMAEAPSSVALPAWNALRERRVLPDTFPALADVSRRREAVQRLVREHHLPHRIGDASLPRPSLLAEAERARYRREVGDALQKLQSEPKNSPAYRAALQRLQKINAAAVPILEELLQQSPENVPEDIFETVLPALHPVYAALRDLRHRDPLVRQRAAQQLAAWGNQSSLSPLVVQRMIERIGRHSDRIVWQYALRAVLPDATPQAEKLALRASQLMAPEVRRLACEYFRRHPDPKFADRILELMNDTTHRSVQLAAIRAAGFCRDERVITGDRKRSSRHIMAAGAPSAGQLPSQTSRSLSQRRVGLLSWAKSSDRELSEAAVVSLARLGHELGYRELHRLSYHPDVRRRERAYRLMGETGKTRFVPHLIRRGAAEKSSRLQAVILESLEKLTPVAERPIGLSQTSRYDVRIRVWQHWLEERLKKRRPVPFPTGRVPQPVTDRPTAPGVETGRNRRGGRREPILSHGNEDYV